MLTIRPKPLPENNSKLPLFPLPNLVFPGGVLPLRVFETHYLDMIANRAHLDEAFGITLLLQNPDDMASNLPGHIGTTVKIIDFEQLPDGILGITCVGVRRFIPENPEKNAVGLWESDIEFLPKPDKNTLPIPEESKSLAQLLQRFYPKLGEPFDILPMHFERADWVGNRLCELLPLDAHTKEGLLRLDDPIERLARLSPISELVNITVD